MDMTRTSRTKTKNRKTCKKHNITEVREMTILKAKMKLQAAQMEVIKVKLSGHATVPFLSLHVHRLRLECS